MPNLHPRFEKIEKNEKIKRKLGLDPLPPKSLGFMNLPTYQTSVKLGTHDNGITKLHVPTTIANFFSFSSFLPSSFILLIFFLFFFFSFLLFLCCRYHP